MKAPHYIVVLAMLTLAGCAGHSCPTQMDSDSFATKQERLAALQQEIQPMSALKDAEFELFNVNGFSQCRAMVAGASSADYRFAVRVAPKDVDKWTQGFSVVDSSTYNTEWPAQLVAARQQAWHTAEPPKLYVKKGQNVVVLVHKPEGIIFKRIVID